MSKTIDPYILLLLGAVFAVAGAVVGVVFLSVSRSQAPSVEQTVNTRDAPARQQATSVIDREVDETPAEQSEDFTETSILPVDATPVADSPEAQGRTDLETAKTMIEAFRGARERDALDMRAREADLETAKTMIELLRVALERCSLDIKGFPTTQQGLRTLLRPPGDADESTVSGWDGPYLKGSVVPKDPWGNDYQYTYPPERGSAEFPAIWSWGPDREGGTEDDICSWTAGTSTSEEDIFAGSTETSHGLGLPGEVANSIGMKLKLIPAGEFMMGSPESDENADNDERPQHRVRITKPFYLGVMEVTQGQWEAVMEFRPWSGGTYVKEGADYAASYISWEDAVAFCTKLSGKEGVTYRLPTEAEWEDACRAGTTTLYHFGDDTSRLGDYAWWGGQFGDGNCQGEKYAHRVGQKKANPFGLYDMHGNVWEWCQDWRSDAYYNYSPSEDPAGPATGSDRVLRGGSWCSHASLCRSAARGVWPPDYRDKPLGYRVVCEIPSEPAELD